MPMTLLRGLIELTLSASTDGDYARRVLYVYDIEQKVIKDDQTPPVDLADPTVVTLIYGTIKINEDITITS
jgi:hypothetical protein